MSSIEPRVLWNSECRNANGPVWLSDAGKLLFCDIDQGNILSFDPQTGESGAMEVGGSPSFIFPTQNGQLLYGSEEELYLITSTGEIELELRIDTVGHNRTHDATVDKNGRLWFGMADKSGNRAGGLLYRYFDERMIPTLLDHILPIGPAITSNADLLYHANGATGAVHRFEMNRAGALSNGDLFLDFGEDQGRPVALSLDGEEHLWVAFAGSGKVRRYSPSAQLVMEIDFPVSTLSGMAFGGEDMKTVFVTTSSCGPDGAVAEGEADAGSLFAFDAPVAGNITPAVKLSHGGNLGLIDDDEDH